MKILKAVDLVVSQFYRCQVDKKAMLLTRTDNRYALSWWIKNETARDPNQLDTCLRR
jgi:hypothetical protein